MSSFLVVQFVEPDVVTVASSERMSLDELAVVVRPYGELACVKPIRSTLGYTYEVTVAGQDDPNTKQVVHDR